MTTTENFNVAEFKGDKETYGRVHPCPTCKKPMRRIDGRMGPFWGCSDFRHVGRPLTKSTVGPALRSTPITAAPCARENSCAPIKRRVNTGFVVATTKVAKSPSMTTKADRKKRIAAKNADSYSLNEKARTGLFGAAAVTQCARQAIQILRADPRYDFLIFKIAEKNRRCVKRSTHRCRQPMGSIHVAGYPVNRAGKRTWRSCHTLDCNTRRCRATRFLAEQISSLVAC